MTLRVDGYGPPDAKIMIVGEAPGMDEEVAGKPFVGASGHLLTTLLGEAGIKRADCYMTNVCKHRPPGNDMSKWLKFNKKGEVSFEHDFVREGHEELLAEIAERRPSVIVGLGNTPLWAITGQRGITDWRGSEMHYGSPDGEIPFVPTIHPAAILRSWPSRSLVAHDLRQRVARRLSRGFVAPVWEFNYSPTFEQAIQFIADLKGDVALDVETSRGQIVCVGLGVSARKAMCIPFISEGYGAYWSPLERTIIIETLRGKLALGEVNAIWQNGNYDLSYFDDNWDFVPPNDFDTLIAQSVLFPGTSRGLGYLSSMYCDWHCYWKDDARDWQNLRDFDRLFAYNCRDVCATWEVAQAQRRALAASNLTAQFEDRMTYSRHVFDMMKRGVIRGTQKTQALETQVEEALQERALIICDAAGHPINPGSPKQVEQWLYVEAGARRPARRGKEAGGTGDEELKQVKAWHPDLQAPLDAIVEYRAIASARNNVLHAKLDPDGRIRSSFMTTGTETFRLTSSTNNFGRGTNLLNITSGNKDKHLPNFRSVFVPPPGQGVFDCDLAKADVWIVAYESDDAYLKHKLVSGNLHNMNALDLFGVKDPSAEVYLKAKRFVHLTNYGGGARMCAIACGISVHEADLAQRRWFGVHPGIEKWHRRIEAQLKATRTVTNVFGYRMVFFDRIDGLLKEALAWIPQSTIALVASYVHEAFDAINGVEVFVQMYDSVAGYYPLDDESRILSEMSTAKNIIVPYPEPFVIPMEIAMCADNWGDCKLKENKREWKPQESA